MPASSRLSRRAFSSATGTRWVVATMTPGDGPVGAARRGAGGGALAPRLRGDRRLAPSGRRRAPASPGLVKILGPLLEKADANLLLVVDQFEEIFRREPDSHASEQHEKDADFVSIVLGLARQRDAPVFVVFTMRSDHLGDCDEYLGLPEALNESQYLVPRLSRDEVRLAIEGPIRLFGKVAAPRLVDRLLNDLGGQHDQLPVLQHALMRMWVRLLESGSSQLDLDHYADVGTLTEALSRHAEEAVVGMDPARVHTAEAVQEALRGIDRAELHLCRVVFQALTETDHANRQVRRWQSLGQLRELTGRSLLELRLLLERFRDDRRSFLRYSIPRESTDAERTLVDISHEALIRQWHRLRVWVQEEAHNRDTYERIRDDARRWAADAPTGGLWEDPALAQARLWWNDFRPTRAWAGRYGGGFAESEKFLEASERKRDREIQREKERERLERDRAELAAQNARTRRTLWRTTAAAVAAVALAAVAVSQWWRAEDASKLAESGEHAAQSLAVARSDPEESLRLAIQAVEKAETPTAIDALHRALEGSVVRKLWSVPLVRASAVAFNPEGRCLAAGGAASGSEPGRAGIWDVETGRLLSSVCDQDVAGLRWTPDGRGLLLGLEDRGVVYWESGCREGASPAVTELVAGRDLRVWDLDVRFDGRELAVAAGSDGLLRFDLVLEPGAGRPHPGSLETTNPRERDPEGRRHLERRLQP